MPKTLILTQSDVRSLVEMERVVAAVEAAFAAHGRGEARMPPKVYLDLAEHGGDFRAMPAYVGGVAGVKWVNSHPDNPTRHGLPAVIGTYILNDADSAAPLAIMDATLLTALRTGAAAAVASKYLARAEPRAIGFVGCGVQARTLLAAHRVIYPDIEVLVADRAQAAAEAFADEIGGTAVAVAVAAGADIVCTSTPSRVPVVDRAWVSSGAHINAMGADAPGKQELDPRILVDARVFIDEWEQATESGEINVPLHSGLLARERIAGTLGDVVAGKSPGRTHADELTVFDSTGLAIQDIALARELVLAARERGVGVDIDLMA